MILHKVEIIVTSADPNEFISLLSSENITIFDVKMIDEITLRLCLSGKNVEKVKRFAGDRNDSIRVVRQMGIVVVLKKAMSRPILLMGMLVWLFLLLYLPSKILFVQVEGCVTVPEQFVIEKAELCGLAFGTERRAIRSERVKNLLLSEIPELQWAGVNTYGCLAVITVRERSVQERQEKVSRVSHIVATQNGVVSSLTVTKGTPLCKIGQAVTKGQILVSGYTDCGLVLRAEEASAEVMAITGRKVAMQTLQNQRVRKEIVDTQIDYSIQIGKNIVELSKRTGIPQAGCAKIYKKKYLTLPGGFRLPLAVICVKTEYYAEEDAVGDIDESELQLLTDSYLKRQMLMGRILSAKYELILDANTCGMKGIYICEEMIGKIRKEETLKENG